MKSQVENDWNPFENGGGVIGHSNFPGKFLFANGNEGIKVRGIQIDVFGGISKSNFEIPHFSCLQNVKNALYLNKIAGFSINGGGNVHQTTS